MEQLMDKATKYLRPIGLVIALIAAVLAIASMSASVNESHHLYPESAIALAVVAFVFVKAGEASSRS